VLQPSRFELVINLKTAIWSLTDEHYIVYRDVPREPHPARLPPRPSIRYGAEKSLPTTFFVPVALRSRAIVPHYIDGI